MNETSSWKVELRCFIWKNKSQNSGSTLCKIKETSIKSELPGRDNKILVGYLKKMLFVSSIEFLYIKKYHNKRITQCITLLKVQINNKIY